MIVNEDGGITGSVDVSKLGEVEPKTDEARAQIDALKAENEAGRAAVDAHAARVAADAAASNPATDEVPQDNRDPQGKSVAPEDAPVRDDPKQADAKADSPKQSEPKKSTPASGKS